jgi:hypothetical protein
MSLASNGAITGTPTLEGDAIFTVQATDALHLQRTGQLNYTLTIATNPCVNSVTLMTATLDQALGLPVVQGTPILSSTAQSRVARAGPTRRSGAQLVPLSDYDLNGDGVVNVVDLQTSIGRRWRCRLASKSLVGRTPWSARDALVPLLLRPARLRPPAYSSSGEHDSQAR